MMATTARPTRSHGHHEEPLDSPAAASVVELDPAAVVDSRAGSVVAGASVRGGDVVGASVAGGLVVGASLVGGSMLERGGDDVGPPPGGAVVGAWVGRVTPDGRVTDPPPELEHDAARIATAMANVASKGLSGRIGPSSSIRVACRTAGGRAEPLNCGTCRAWRQR